jgi:peptide/nickel transport system ATP-binding protein
MTDAAASLVSVRDLKVDFRGDEGAVLHAVRGVSFDIPSRGTVAIVGESGSGKSVTALAMLGLLPRSNATVLPGSRVEMGGENLLELPPARMRAVRGGEISMVFQEPMSSLNPVFTAGFQLAEVLKKHAGLSARRARARAVELLREVGIPEPEARLRAYPHELSGGQQQRVMIAMAIACEPKLLIADEPTTALDVTVERQILKLIAEIQARRQMAMLFITHDLALVAEIADHVVVMRDGEVREQGSVRRIFEDPSDDYTRALLACRPPLSSRPRRLAVVDDFRDGAAPPRQPERARGLAGNEETVLEVRHLARHFHFREGLFGRRTFVAVKDLSFKLARGRTLGVVGESGSGKTTMALAVMRLGPAAGGEVLFDGRDLLALPPAAALPYKRRIQIVFQNPYASLNPRFTAGEILMEPMRIHGVGAGEAERAAMARELLGKVGLTAGDFLKYPHEFSGGQRQRIAIARCLTVKPDVLICDEAVSALDVSVQAQLLNLLQDLQDEYRMSYVFISHDLAVVRYMADEVMVMRGGEVVELANSDELYARPAHPYTRELLSAMPAGWRGAAAG